MRRFGPSGSRTAPTWHPLAVAYVLLPYGLGTVAAGTVPSRRGLVLAGALFLFFVGGDRLPRVGL